MTKLARPPSTKTRKGSRISELVDGGVHAMDPVAEGAGNVLGEIVEFLCEAGGSLLEGL
jgi:hypothetical protein